MGGLLGVNAKCRAEFPGSRMCTDIDILKSDITSVLADAWFYSTTPLTVRILGSTSRTYDVNCARYSRDYSSSISWGSIITRDGNTAAHRCDQGSKRIACCTDGSGGSTQCTLSDLEIGENCNGAIYAGESGGNRIYTKLTNQGEFAWKTESTTTPGTSSSSDGLANTNAMIDAGADLHPAAQACRALGSDWYLPAVDELDMLWQNRSQILGGLVGNSYYWSSTEANTWQGNVYAPNFNMPPNNYNIYVTNKAQVNSRLVHCVRRD